MTPNKARAVIPLTTGRLAKFRRVLRSRKGKPKRSKIAKVGMTTTPTTDKYWINPAGGDWTDGSNWSDGRAPCTFLDNVTIGPGAKIIGPLRVGRFGREINMSLVTLRQFTKRNLIEACLGEL